MPPPFGCPPADPPQTQSDRQRISHMQANPALPARVPMPTHDDTAPLLAFAGCLPLQALPYFSKNHTRSRHAPSDPLPGGKQAFQYHEADRPRPA